MSEIEANTGSIRLALSKMYKNTRTFKVLSAVQYIRENLPDEPWITPFLDSLKENEDIDTLGVALDFAKEREDIAAIEVIERAMSNEVSKGEFAAFIKGLVNKP